MKKLNKVYLCVSLIAMLVIGVGIGYFAMPVKTDTIYKNVTVEKIVTVDKVCKDKIIYKDRIVTIHETEGSSTVSNCAKLHDISKCKPLVNGQRT
jgi:hypothetical protein